VAKWWEKGLAVAVAPVVAVPYLIADELGWVDPAGRVVKRGLGMEAPRVETITTTVQAPTPIVDIALPWVVVLAGVLFITRERS